MTMQPLGQPGQIPAWTVADRLRKAREAAGYDMGGLADVTGLSRNTIGNYEGGKVKPRRSGMIVWAMATGVPLSWIETGAETENAPDPDGGTEGVDRFGGDVRSKGLEPPTF